MDDEKRADLASVLAAVWRPARKRTADATIVQQVDVVSKLLLRDFSRPRAGAPLELEGTGEGGKICGKRLQLARDAPFRVGGSGVVLPCEEADVPGVRYALKVGRPSKFGPKDAELEAKKAERETRQHLPLSHENVAKMLGSDRVACRLDRSGVHVLYAPCSLLEWVDGAEPLDRYLAEKATDPFQVADILRQTCRGLAHLHGFQRIHWDVKGDNVLVSAAGTVKLMDLGNARELQAEGERYAESSTAETSYRNLPRRLQDRVTERVAAESPITDDPITSLNRVSCDLFPGEATWDRPWLDLYMLAREFNRLIGFDEATLALDTDIDSSALASTHKTSRTVEEREELRNRLFGDDDGRFVYEYLEEITKRLLHADVPGIRPFYAQAQDVAVALDRLFPEYGEATDVRELQAVPQKVLRIPPNDNVPWTRRIDVIMNSEPLLRLKEHHQLASVHHVFPGAVHSRWEHTIGSFNELLQYVRALYADRTSVFFRLETTKLDITAIMLASLLHDIGHPAFGHQLEECAVVLPRQRHEGYAIEVLQCLSRPTGQECAGAQADARALQPLLERHWTSEWTLDELVARVLEVLKPSALARDEEDEVAVAHRVHTELLHSLIDGDLDIDRMDYIRRDAHHAGVEYANGIDKRRLEQALTSVLIKDRGGRTTALLGVTEKGILPLESMIIARYQMFRAVYWQHTVRAMTVMLQEAVEELVTDRRRPIAVIDEQRLDEVLSQFRRLDDDAAIEWLETELPARSKHLCRGLRGRREDIYWDVADLYGGKNFELGSNAASGRAPEAGLASGPRTADLATVLRRRSVPRGQSPGETTDANPHSETDETFRALQRLWSPDDTRTPIVVLEDRLALRRALIAALNAERTRKPPLGLSDVLLDVPVVGKDDVTDLYVTLGGDGMRRTESLDEVTPLAAAVKEAFRRSARTARVFVHPRRSREALGDYGTPDAFGRAVHEALKNALAQHSPEPAATETRGELVITAEAARDDAIG